MKTRRELELELELEKLKRKEAERNRVTRNITTTVVSQPVSVRRERDLVDTALQVGVGMALGGLFFGD